MMSIIQWIGTASKTITKTNIFQIVFYAGEFGLGQATTVIESVTANVCHAVGDAYRFQATATIESITADTCHAIGDGDGGQITTARECTIADACHAGGNDKVCYLASSDIQMFGIRQWIG